MRLTHASLCLLALSLVGAARALDYDRIDCWRGNLMIDNFERYLSHAGVVTQEQCDESCWTTPGCELVMQYRYDEEPERPGSCFLMRSEACRTLLPGEADPNPGWHYRPRARPALLEPSQEYADYVDYA